MSSGTAQPTLEQLAATPHHFINCIEPTQNFSAGEFGGQGRAKIAELQAKGIVPLIVGGSGLYTSALADDFFNGPAADPDIRRQLKSRAAYDGIAALYAELQATDPAAAARILPSDLRRVERALEIYYLTGVPISQLRKQQANPPPYLPILVGLEWPRTELYERINARCLRMLESGLVKEVKHLLEVKKYDPATCNALNGVGYAEVILYLQGHIDYAEMTRLFKRNSRRFAKRQISWFGRDTRIRWVKMGGHRETGEAAQEIMEIYGGAGIKGRA
jgi:tRNA dimethylallyltransferase